MKKELSRILITAVFLSLACLPNLVFAEFQYTQLENIPGFPNISSSDFPNYVVNIFKFGIWIAGISAMLMIMIGGYMYITSAGNNANMEKAKKFITDAVIGLILALFSWLLLYTINPELTQINRLQGTADIEEIKKIGSGIKIKDSTKDLADFSVEGGKDISDQVKKYGDPRDDEDNEEKLEESDSWYFKQSDPAWAGKEIDSSNLYMGGYGCAITSLAMVLKKHGVDIDPGELVDDGSYTTDGYINWPTSWEGVKLSSSLEHAPVSIPNSKTDKEIANGNPVIVCIKALNGKTHYVVIIGKDDKGYLVNDPALGAGLYLDVSEAKMASLFKSSVHIDQVIIYK